jgi:glycerophosphoryl diester phosphodiesterase
MRNWIIGLALICVVSVSNVGSTSETNKKPLNVYNRAEFQAAAPVLCAHRGGVITDEAAENTLLAVELAAERGYGMMEVDVQESKDHVPVCFHDRSMMEACEIDDKIGNYTVDQITKIYFKGTKQRICTLDEYFALCSKHGMAIMLDIKDNGSDRFFQAIADLTRKHGLDKSTVTIARFPKVETFLKDICLMRMTKEDQKKVENNEPVDLTNKFWFDWPRYITNETIAKLHEKDVMVIPSINVFHYPKDEHMERAQKDIDRMKEAKVDAYQIDSVYDQFLQKK